ncbi:MAG: glycosyltransferase [Deltaproteobacteria bacterium]|nr:glycosyltransferase [Deltaproteobacteria bacterium]
MNTPQPKVTIIIPIYNEEGILAAAINDLVDRLNSLNWSYELVLAENGSSDRTVEIARELSQRHSQLSFFSIGEPNYGKALRKGILEAKGEYVFCDEIDLCDTDFYTRAMVILQSDKADFVVGSKLSEGANDKRPFIRHAGSLVINAMLRVSLGFRGTDTHGLKAFRRDRLIEVARSCIVDRDLFASEFVIRSERLGIQIEEIPVSILEKRAPSTTIYRRVPNVLLNLAKLVVAIRFKG